MSKLKLPTDIQLEACSYYEKLSTLIFRLDMAEPAAIDLLIAMIKRDSDSEDPKFTALYLAIINAVQNFHRPDSISDGPTVFICHNSTKELQHGS